MALSGLVRQFSLYTEQQLEQMKTDLGIQMPIPKLRACAAYYGKQAMRDPYIEELRFLDLFYNAVSASPEALVPRELLTNDAFVAQTYADLMNKRRELLPNAKKPASATELLWMINGYLTKIGKHKTAPQKAILFENTEFLPGISEHENLISTPTSKAAFLSVPLRSLPYEPTDLLVLLTPAKELSAGEYAPAFHAFLENTELCQSIKAMRSVGIRGILYEALQLANGIKIQMDRLSIDSTDLPLSGLVNAHHGAHILRVGTNKTEALIKACKKLGLCALPFGSLQNNSTVVVMRGNETEVSWGGHFIRSFFAMIPVSLHLKDEADGNFAPVDNRFSKVGRSKYLVGNEEDALATRKTADLQTYAVSHAKPTNAFFKNTLDTALASVLSLSASGIPYSEQTLAANILIPGKKSIEETASDTVSAILGLSRLEAELAIPMQYGKIEPTSSSQTLEITVLAFGSEKKLPDRATTEGAGVYCITPEYTEDGIPSFESLRTMLAWLENAANNGTVKSARILCRKTLEDALAQFGTRTLECNPTAPEYDDAQPIRLAVLLESLEELPFCRVATVREKAPCEQVPAPAETIPNKDCLIAGEKTSVVLCAEPTDRDVQALAYQLAKRGASVTLCVGNEAPEALAQKLLQSQVLIVCGSAMLSNENKYLRFALETFSRANGTILLTENAKIAKIKNTISLANGISEQILDQIVKKAD